MLRKHIKKTVTFTADTKDPPPTERCSCCGHRNIIPRIREMDLCMECFKNTCSECLTSMGICASCESELLEIDSRRGSSDNGEARYPKDNEEVEEYPEFSDDEDVGD